jgi:hypothetical protein
MGLLRKVINFIAHEAISFTASMDTPGKQDATS